ncbi:monofunctional biosynthetic peptidoglycan transglycosylase [Echinicola vietnamensis]|uniref:Biosynthetic peptidoglycan transglycosylase n=1 Tax=Echinicola vietnamensis (strain DSM 17526 / LMG 23754 / KMM 6221) TaxID=926556 RepID=U3GM55_ECHVK|nr:monofunctional biosynthetic peptidoglycan transglycosylase [Echinicola vietnamensis]AGA77425.1 monofunctional biosynthetic peptidoglycan transglycosylase [Echinicola vietnamensis DSM 17526]
MKKIWRFIVKIILWFFILSIGMTLVYKYVPVYLTPLMVIRMVEQATDEQRKVRLKKDWVSMDEISKHLAQAVVASEDQKFLDHFGFDMEAIDKALEENKSGKRIRGGSTISNQTAKNVFLWPGRNYVRKGLEAYFTLLIELLWSKERIMEVYLNVIEMGDGIYGAEAASQEFYHKPAAKLSRQEAAMIAAVLPNPLRWSPAKPTAYNFKRQAWILRNMNNLHPVGFGK